jgi:hypothetical protein
MQKAGNTCQEGIRCSLFSSCFDFFIVGMYFLGLLKAERIVGVRVIPRPRPGIWGLSNWAIYRKDDNQLLLVLQCTKWYMLPEC